MTETEAALAKQRYETLVKVSQEFNYKQVIEILTVAEMSDSDIKGAIAHVINAKKGAKVRDTAYTPVDVLKLFLAGGMAKTARARIAESTKENERFTWDNLRLNQIPGMVMLKKDELIYQNPLGQKVMGKMISVANLAETDLE